MKRKLHTAARLIFGLAFLIFGLNGFLNFMPNPPMTPEAGSLIGAFAKTGYFFPMIKIVEMVVGLMFLTNMFAALAAILITPVLVGITTIHLFLNPAGIPIMIVLHLLHGLISIGYRNYYRILFNAKSTVS
ncbi:hypothetical protein OAB57_00350 [Bacteriovoracaceae bacterium]|nr:hypothetical protein [Bacteriovoracaceae bacterium]